MPRKSTPSNKKKAARSSSSPAQTKELADEIPTKPRSTRSSTSRTPPATSESHSGRPQRSAGRTAAAALISSTIRNRSRSNQRSGTSEDSEVGNHGKKKAEVSDEKEEITPRRGLKRNAKAAAIISQQLEQIGRIAKARGKSKSVKQEAEEEEDDEEHDASEEEELPAQATSPRDKRKRTRSQSSPKGKSPNKSSRGRSKAGPKANQRRKTPSKAEDDEEEIEASEDATPVQTGRRRSTRGSASKPEVSRSRGRGASAKDKFDDDEVEDDDVEDAIATPKQQPSATKRTPKGKVDDDGSASIQPVRGRRITQRSLEENSSPLRATRTSGRRSEKLLPTTSTKTTMPPDQTDRETDEHEGGDQKAADAGQEPSKSAEMGADDPDSETKVSSTDEKPQHVDGGGDDKEIGAGDSEKKPESMNEDADTEKESKKRPRAEEDVPVEIVDPNKKIKMDSEAKSPAIASKAEAGGDKAPAASTDAIAAEINIEKPKKDEEEAMEVDPPSETADATKVEGRAEPVIPDPTPSTVAEKEVRVTAAPLAPSTEPVPEPERAAKDSAAAAPASPDKQATVAQPEITAPRIQAPDLQDISSDDSEVIKEESLGETPVAASTKPSLAAAAEETLPVEPKEKTSEQAPVVASTETKDDIKESTTATTTDVVKIDAKSAEPVTDTNVTEDSINSTVNGTGHSVPSAPVPHVNDVLAAKTNGVPYESKEVSVLSATLGEVLTRKFILANNENMATASSEDQDADAGKFAVVSYNLTNADGAPVKKEALQLELRELNPIVFCVQGIDSAYFETCLQPTLKEMSYMGEFYKSKAAEHGLATFYRSNIFEKVDHRGCEIHDLAQKDVESSGLEESEKEALKTFLHRPVPVLYLKLKSLDGKNQLCICNVNLPAEDLSMHALQVAAIVRELASQSGGSADSHLLCGTFNMEESCPGYQVLKDGYLSSEMIEDLQARKDVPIPNKENAALVNLLWKCFQHSSSSLKSSYHSLLGHELSFPANQQKNTKDYVWYSSDSLNLLGVLNAPVESAASSKSHISLKAELSFAARSSK